MPLPLACLKRYLLKVLYSLSQFVQHYYGLKCPPKCKQSKSTVLSISIDILGWGEAIVPTLFTTPPSPWIFIPSIGSEYRIASDSGSSSNQLYFKRVSNKGDVCWPIYAPFIRNFTVQPFLLSDVYFGRDCARLYCHSAAR